MREGGPFLSKRGYLNRIKQANLDIAYGGFICESFGAFGKEAWDFITKIDDRELIGGDADGYSPWGRPAWKRHCILSHHWTLTFATFFFYNARLSRTPNQPPKRFGTDCGVIIAKGRRFRTLTVGRR